MTEPNITERMLPRFSIRRPVTVTMILTAILVVGFISYSRIKLDLMPSGLSAPFLGVWIPVTDWNEPGLFCPMKLSIFISGGFAPMMTR
jgi:hypothetical protein